MALPNPIQNVHLALGKKYEDHMAVPTFYFKAFS
jgi:hypothetical protein